VRVSKQFGVLCRFTAFVAIDRSGVVNAGGVLHQVVQPVEPPSGWASPPGAPAAAPGVTRIMMMASAQSPPEEGVLPPAAAMLPPPPRRAPLPPSPSPLTPIVVPASRSSGPPSPREPIAEVAPPETHMAYRSQLAHHAAELTALAAAGTTAPDRVRGLRLRLIQWVEDLRSVGGSRDLASAVEALIVRLSAALAAPVMRLDEVAAVADGLALLATGAQPAPPGRPAFWK
jgi:Ca-activated chloride channel family protein